MADSAEGESRAITELDIEREVLRATDGYDRQIARQDIECTNFPLLQITLFFTDHVLLLPSEY
ncbi:MAG: hypothetical protein RIG62_17980 [Cyclobacteriaceae bacterium]